MSAAEKMVERVAWAAYGEHMASYIGPYHWNPFPRTSAWGRRIEEAYLIQELERRRRADLSKEQGNG